MDMPKPIILQPQSIIATTSGGTELVSGTPNIENVDGSCCDALGACWDVVTTCFESIMCCVG